MSASDAALRALGGAVERLSMTVMSQQSGHLSNVDASSQHGHGTVKSLASSGSSRKIPSVSELRQRLRESSMRVSGDRTRVAGGDRTRQPESEDRRGPSESRISEDMVRALGTAVERLSMAVAHQSRHGTPRKDEPIRTDIGGEHSGRDRGTGSSFRASEADAMPLRGSVSTRGALDWINSTSTFPGNVRISIRSPQRDPPNASEPCHRLSDDAQAWQLRHEQAPAYLGQALPRYAEPQRQGRHDSHLHPPLGEATPIQADLAAAALAGTERTCVSDWTSSAGTWRTSRAAPPLEREQKAHVRRGLFPEEPAPPPPRSRPLSAPRSSATSLSEPAPTWAGATPPRQAKERTRSASRSKTRGTRPPSTGREDLALRRGNEVPGAYEAPYRVFPPKNAVNAASGPGSGSLRVDATEGGAHHTYRFEAWGSHSGGDRERAGSAVDPVEAAAGPGDLVASGSSEGLPPRPKVAHAVGGAHGGDRGAVGGPLGDSWRAAGQGLPLQGEDEDGGRAMAGESVEVYPDVTGSFRSSALLGSPKKIAQSGLPPKELLQLPKRDLIQIIAAQRLRVAGLSKAVKALQQEKKDLSEELSLIREVSNRGSATPTAQHVTRKPAGALTRARVRESELLGELKRLREESRAAERSRGLAEAREKLIAELRARGREREEEARQLRKEREDLRGERADLEKEVKASRAEAERLAQRNHGLVERMGKMADTLSRSTDEIETLRGQLAEAEAAVEQFRWHRDATEQGRQEALREVARLRGVVRKLAGRAREAGGGLAGGQADAGVCVDVDVDVTATAGGAAGCGGVGGQPPTTRRDAGSGEARPGRSGAEMLSEAFEEVGRAFGGLGTERAAVRGEGGPEAGCGGSRREFLSWNAEREGWGAASRAPTEAEEGRGARAGVPLRWEGARGARGEAWKRVGGVERDGMAEEDEVEEEWEEESMSFSDD